MFSEHVSRVCLCKIQHYDWVL